MRQLTPPKFVATETHLAGCFRAVALCVLVSFAPLSLCGCLKKFGDAESAEEAQKSFIVGRWAFRRLEAAEAAVAKRDYPGAKAKLSEMLAYDDLNQHEQALMWQLWGNIHADEGDYPAALDALAKCLALDALPKITQSTVQYNLGQLYAIAGQYQRATDLLEEWLSHQKKPASREIQLMLANAHVQLGQHQRALAYVEAVVATTETADENLLLLQLAIRFELKHREAMVELLTELIERFPKKVYWLQLSAAHSQLGDDRRALAVLELAHRQGLLTEAAELIRLAQHYLHMNLPYQAASLIEAGQASGRIPMSAKQFELLSNSWSAAREPDKAIAALGQAAKKATTGTLHFKLGQLYMQQERWANARNAFLQALKRGKLASAGTVQLRLGHTLYELGQRAAARQAFQQAGLEKGSKKAAQSWLGVMQQEEASCPTGQEAACKLIPGHH